MAVTTDWTDKEIVSRLIGILLDTLQSEPCQTKVKTTISQRQTDRGTDMKSLWFVQSLSLPGHYIIHSTQWHWDYQYSAILSETSPDCIYEKINKSFIQPFGIPQGAFVLAESKKSRG